MRVQASVRRTSVQLTDEIFDFEESSRPRKGFIIASLQRSGSQFLFGELWKTGLLGAPLGYFDPDNMRQMTNRLRASTARDYVTKLLACRTSPNGVFGMKVQFPHFKAFLRDCPDLLDALKPVTFFYLTRGDKVAQAVSLAKAYQTNAWSSRMKVNQSAAQYNRDLIETCLKEIARDEHDWEQWFASNDITPHRVHYEDLIDDPEATARSFIELLEVQNDTPATINIPPFEKQADSTNEEWVARFKVETAPASEPDHFAAAAAAKPVRDLAKLVGLYNRFTTSLAPVNNSSPVKSFIGINRSRQLFNGIIEQQRQLFDDARVLEFPSGDGRWGLAALEAGASRFVGIEPVQRQLAKAARTFAGYGISPDLYRFVDAEIYPALRRFQPGSFDLILCLKSFEDLDIVRVFHELQRLRPKFVLLDTAVAAAARGPVLRFALRRPAAGPANHLRPATGSDNLICKPSHGLIALLCEVFGFHYRAIDWRAMGITDWTGLHDYERGQRRTYLLERSSSASGRAS